MAEQPSGSRSPEGAISPFGERANTRQRSSHPEATVRKSLPEISYRRAVTNARDGVDVTVETPKLELWPIVKATKPPFPKACTTPPPPGSVRDHRRVSYYSCPPIRPPIRIVPSLTL